MFLAPLAPFIGGAMSLVGGIAGGMAAKSAAEANAKAAEAQGAQARVKGDMDAANLARQQRQEAGSQRSRLSASGTTMGQGNAANIQADTAFIQSVDQNTLEYNTRMNVWGYQAEAVNQRAKGKNAMLSGVIGGVTGAASGLASGYMSSTPATGGTLVRS